jgi:HEPN domain-containing protein
MKKDSRNSLYVEWQNRAFHFYIAARLLYFNQHIPAAAFCGQQAIELMLKATLLYHDKSFIPENVKHKFRKMINALKNKMKNSGNVFIPEYFYYDGQYQSFTRYPSNKEGLFLPDNLVDDLDKCFYDLFVLVPCQIDTLLVKTLENPEKIKKMRTLKRKNKQFKNILSYIKNVTYRDRE